jgi:CMP-N-acetylneuraminic acid synthetase
MYARNGPAVLALRPERFGEVLYGSDVRPFVMDERDSLDVDTPEDLELAELLLTRRRAA